MPYQVVIPNGCYSALPEPACGFPEPTILSPKEPRMPEDFARVYTFDSEVAAITATDLYDKQLELKP